jgi:hypothetical protein
MVSRVRRIVRPIQPALAPVAVGVVVFIAARMALLPGLGFWDTAEYQAVGPLLGTVHPTGFPTWVLLAWLASVVLQPFGDPALRMNLFAAICLATAAGITVVLARTLTRSTALAVLAGLGMGLAPAAWAIGTHAETHGLHLALTAILLCLLVGWEDRARDPDPERQARADRWLIAAAFVCALSVGNHSLTLLLAPPIALFVFAVDPRILRRPGLVVRCVAVLAVTVFVLYLELPLRAGPFRAPLVYGRPETLEGFLYVVLAEQFRGSLVDPFGDLGGKAVAVVTRAAVQFGPLTPLIPLGFLATVVRRPRYALLTGSAAVITCFFASSYVNADIGRYYLVPWLVAWTWLAILGAVVASVVANLVTGGRDLFAESSGPRYRRLASVVAIGFAVILVAPTVVAIPARYRAVDESWDRSAPRWVDRALQVMAPDALIVSWWSHSTPLWYAQLVEGRRPDLTIVDDRTIEDEGLGDIYKVIDANLGVRPVYVIRDDVNQADELARRYELEFLEGNSARYLTRVLGHRGDSR